MKHTIIRTILNNNQSCYCVKDIFNNINNIFMAVTTLLIYTPSNKKIKIKNQLQLIQTKKKGRSLFPKIRVSHFNHDGISRAISTLRFVKLDLIIRGIPSIMATTLSYRFSFAGLDCLHSSSTFSRYRFLSETFYCVGNTGSYRIVISGCCVVSFRVICAGIATPPQNRLGSRSDQMTVPQPRRWLVNVPVIFVSVTCP